LGKKHGGGGVGKEIVFMIWELKGEKRKPQAQKGDGGEA